jgi:hypothetical protein
LVASRLGLSWVIDCFLFIVFFLKGFGKFVTSELLARYGKSILKFKHKNGDTSKAFSWFSDDHQIV